MHDEWPKSRQLVRDVEQQESMDGERQEQQSNVHVMEQPRVEHGVHGGEPIDVERERKLVHGMLELEQSMEREQLDELQQRQPVCA